MTTLTSVLTGRASPSARVIGSASSDALCARALAILRSSVLARPDLFTSDLLVDRCYFVVIQFIVFSAVVVSLSTRKRQTTLFALWLPKAIRYSKA